MTAKIDQFPAINSNPVLSVAKDGVILYSNEAGKPLLHDWGVRVGEKLPLNLEIFVQRAISRKSIEEIEVNMGKKVYFIVFHPLPEQECVNIYGFDISDRKKPEGKLRESEIQETANLELANIIDVKAVQSLMSDFYTLAHIPMALLDLKSNILVSVGWQDICTKFHRANPEACKHCVESDINLTAGVNPGGYKLYKCKNNMWDVVTPIIVEGQHVGNIFSGQFFFEDETLDYELFRSQARQYGFNEEEYIKALEKVPRLSRKAVDTSMAFFMTFANMISQLSYSNIKLSQSLAERDAVVDALQESEKSERARSNELAVVLDAVPVSVYIAHDPQSLQITGNRLSYEWLRIPLGTNLSKSAPEGEKPEMFKLFKDGIELQPADMPSQLSATGIEINDCELDIVSADGEIRHVLGNARPLRDEQGNLRGSISAFIDITERKKAEEALRLSNLYNRSLIEASLDPLVTIGRDGKITDVNNATEQVTGYSRNELIGTDFSDYFTEPEKACKGYQQVFMRGEVRDYPLEIRHKDGHITPVLYNASVYRGENGKVIGVFAAARDITERKRVEEALQKSEAGLARAQQTSMIGSWTWDLVTNEVTWSEQSYRNYGLVPGEVKPSYELFLSFIVPEDRERVEGEVQKAIESGHKYNVTYNIIRRDGTPRILLSENEIITDESGKIVLMYGTNQDITERKRVEEERKKALETLRYSEDQFRGLFQNVKSGVALIDEAGRFALVNPSFMQMFGLDNELDILNINSQDWSRWEVYGEDGKLLHVDDHPVRKAMITGKPVKGQLVAVRNPGANELTWMLISAEPVLKENGHIYRVICTYHDITERKRAEEALKQAHDTLEEKVKERTAELQEAYNSLKESEERLADSQKIAHIGNWDWNITTNEEYWSDELYHIFGLDSQFELNHNTFLDCIHPDDLDYVNNAINEALNGKPYYIDYRIFLPDGEERIIYSEGGVLFDENNTPIRMRGIVQDITERKKAEEALANLETARKKEIHHRIKNNLQVISSLLDLQAEQFRNRDDIKNSEVLEAFRESQDRVISMALIHEELYKGEEFETLNFSPYIEELANTLFQTYSLGDIEISLNMDMEENLFFDMDIAVPLGMIVNELVSNSLKHAFTGRDRGEIRIKLHREEPTELETEGYESTSTSFTLTISDNGVGIPENLDIEDLDSLGMQLVTSLVDQLDGKLEMKRNNGTEFTIRFTVTEKR